MILENVAVGTELAKRTCLEGVVLKKNCTCGFEMSCDLSSNYLSYPVVGVSESLYMYCESCHKEHEEALKVKIIMNLEVDGLDGDV